jgi:hypothetical protein
MFRGTLIPQEWIWGKLMIGLMISLLKLKVCEDVNIIIKITVANGAL